MIIVGGGAVGIELAGEIADKYSAKMITIIHSNTSLVIIVALVAAFSGVLVTLQF